MSKKRIKELEKLIKEARNLYYNKQPGVTDAVYDAWIDELTELDPENKAVTAVGAPVEPSEWKKAKHDIPMGSLNKVNTIDEFKAWAKNCDNYDDFLITHKLDGLSLNTVWEKGRLIQALTRGGDGFGENITINVVKMNGIPVKLDKDFSGSLRGEIVLLKDIHLKHFPEMANPRNAASGIAKRLDGKGVQHLHVFMYQAIGKDFDTEIEQFDFLKSLGVLVPDYYHGDADTVVKIYNEYERKAREELEYDVDGLVIRINDIAKQLSLGHTHDRPKGAIAFKFAPATKETTLRRIVWQVGNSGRITPVAEFDEISLCGVKVNRASLHNYSNIKKLKLDIGAKVIVSRNNDVIPQILETVKNTGTVAKHPDNCPECNYQLEFNGEYLVCKNQSGCSAQTIGRLKIWINELNILEWGEAILQRVIEAGLVQDIGDLYRVTAVELENLDRMGAKSAAKLVKIMADNREIPLENLLGGLGIEGVATSTSKLIVDRGYDTLDAIYKLTQTQLENIPGFGSIRAAAFYNGIRNNKTRIDDILAAGVKIKPRTDGKLRGFTFCFTGSSNKPRKELQKLVTDNGGDVKNSVGKGLTYLVMADPDSNSSKAVAARKHGTKCISEDEFLAML